MKTLQVVRNLFDSMGLSSKLEPFNKLTLTILVVAALGISSQWIFLFHEADNSQEYMESIYVATCCTGVFLSFTSTIFITKKLFSFIDSVDKLFNESKWNCNLSNLKKSVCIT